MNQYSTGSVTTAAGSSSVTGIGTAWASNVRAGHLLSITGTVGVYNIVSVASDTSLTLDAPYPDTLVSQSYVIQRSFTPALNLPLPYQGDGDWLKMLARTLRQLDGISSFGYTDVDPVLAIRSGPPVEYLSVGDRYLVDGTGTLGEWVGQENNIAEWNGSSWDYTPYEARMRVFDIGNGNTYYCVNSMGVVWTIMTVYQGAFLGLANPAIFTTDEQTRIFYDSVLQELQVYVNGSLAHVFKPSA